MSDDLPHRDLDVPEVARGMRLDRFLAARFPDRSRSWLARGIREGLVMNEEGQPLRASTTMIGGERLRLRLEGIAATEPAPPFPPILHEDDRLVVLNKPAGLLVHPTGTNFAWAVISLSKQRWPDQRVDLVHRLDRDTSGVLVLTKDLGANRFLKAQLVKGRATKLYQAVVRGRPTWDTQRITAPLGPADGVIRIQRAVRPDGQSADTEVEVLSRGETTSLVQCRIRTGRTHQIRVHLHHVGHPLVGDRLYGVPPEVFLAIQDHGMTPELTAQVGGPRHLLHAARIVVPHPSGGTLDVSAPLPEDMLAMPQA